MVPFIMVLFNFTSEITESESDSDICSVLFPTQWFQLLSGQNQRKERRLKKPTNIINLNPLLINSN